MRKLEWRWMNRIYADISHVTTTTIFANSRRRTAAILKIALSQYSGVNYPISIKFGMQMQISIPRTDIWHKSKFCIFKMVDILMVDIENVFLAISRRHIGRLMRNLEWRWRIACRCRSRDQHGNFRKLKMADGRYFENSFISISQCWISRQIQIFIPSMDIWQTNRKFANSRWRTHTILRIVFWLYLGAILADVCESWRADVESHANRGHVTKTAIFDNSTWR